MYVAFCHTAMQKIHNTVKSAFNRYEVGGVLLGHKHCDTYCIIDVTIPNKNSTKTYYEFKLNGDSETKAAIKVSLEYDYQLEFLGVWHSHPNQNLSFSNQDKITNKFLARKYDCVLSMLTILNDNGDVAEDVYEIVNCNKETKLSLCNSDKIPTHFLQKRRI